MRYCKNDTIDKLGYIVSDPKVVPSGTKKNGDQFDTFATFCYLPVNSNETKSISIDLAFLDEIKAAISEMEKCQKIIISGYYGDRNYFYATEVRAVNSWKD